MSQDAKNGRSRRNHFRIKYPYTDRPKLTMSAKGLEVIDISEQGVRFSLNGTMQATITFHDGQSLHVEGKIIRTQNDEIVIQLSRGIPSDRILKEQKYLMGKYIGYRDGF